jgi:hypothetical protein
MSATDDHPSDVTPPDGPPAEIRDSFEMMAHGRLLTDEERSQKAAKRRKLRDAQDHCSHCHRCERPFAPDDPVWLQRVSVGRGMFGGGSQNYLVPICKECIFGTHMYEWSGGSYECYNFREPWMFEHKGRECQGCGRKVHQRARVIWDRGVKEARRVLRNRKIVACCGECRDKVAKPAASKAARDRRTAERGTRECEECGETFEPSRTDGKFCRPACRQKAYRKRVTDNKSV